MKAHIPAKAALSKKSKQAVREYIDSYEKDCMRRLLKLSCVALHTDEKDPYGTYGSQDTSSGSLNWRSMKTRYSGITSTSC